MEKENYDAIDKAALGFSTNERALLDRFQAKLGFGDGDFFQLLILFTRINTGNAPRLRTVRLPKS